ncbi:MAG: MFS transporter [Alphaproteobacteria bacterium]
MTRQTQTMIVCGVIIVLIAGGLRQSFGVFLKPITLDLDIGRQVFGSAIAIQALLFGGCQPIAGMLADRYGAFRVISVGAMLYAFGLLLAGQSRDAVELLLSMGVLVGIGLSGATQVVVLGAVGKVIPNEQRGTVFGIIIAAGSVGMFALVPGAQALLSEVGWRNSLTFAAVAILLLPIIALGLYGKQTPITSGPPQSLMDAIREARGHSGYVLLTMGFFVCGFHVTFVGTHLLAYLADNDVSSTAASYALGVIGLCNVIGAFVFGRLSDRYSKKNILTIIYLGRAVLMTCLLVFPITDVTAIIFGICMGLMWLATVPLTSGIVAQVFGARHFSMLYGIVFMSHQFGGFSGAWLGGYVVDKTGSYDIMWALAIALGLIAAALHWPIKEAPLARLTATTA